LDEETFSACLNRHIRRSGLSLSQLARRSWLDISYVSRLVHLKCDPLTLASVNRATIAVTSRDAVIRLGFGDAVAAGVLGRAPLAASTGWLK